MDKNYIVAGCKSWNKDVYDKVISKFQGNWLFASSEEELIKNIKIHDPGNYKENGVYYFGNKKSLAIPTNEETDLPSIFRMIDYFMEKL